jgi:hypothetical protein
MERGREWARQQTEYIDEDPDPHDHTLRPTPGPRPIHQDTFIDDQKLPELRNCPRSGYYCNT